MRWLDRLRGSLNPFFLMALLYSVLAAAALAYQALWLAGFAPAVPGIVWTRVHLLTIGVVAQYILGALPSTISRRTGLPEPGAGLQWGIWLLANGSFIALLLSVPVGTVPVALAGAIGIIAALVLMLGGIWRTGAGARVGSDAVSRLLLSAPMFFVAGVLLAMQLIANWPAPGGPGGVLESHLHANIWGLFGLFMAAVLLERIPGGSGAALRFPGLVSPMSWLLIAGAAALVVGPWSGVLPVTMLGLVTYVTGTVLLVVNLAATVRSSGRWTPNLAHVLTGYLWVFAPVIAAPIVLLATGTLPAGDVEAAAIFSLVAGWILQLTFGAILPSIRGARGAEVDRDGWWITVWLVNAGVFVVWIGAFAGNLSNATTALGFALVTAGWLPQLIDVIRSPDPSQ